MMFQKDTTEDAPVYNNASQDHKKPKSKYELPKKVLEGQESLSQEDVRSIFEQVKRISRHSIPLWSSLCNFCGANKRDKRSRLLQKVNDRLDSQLDVRSIVKAMTDIDILLKVLMTDEQRLLFNFQKRRVITQRNSNESVSNESSESEDIVADIGLAGEKRELMKRF